MMTAIVYNDGGIHSRENNKIKVGFCCLEEIAMRRERENSGT
jgi:hypothetical protein